jgi:hypothetical protein
MNDALGKKAPIASELLKAIRRSFEQIEDPRRRSGSIVLADALMSAVAMFALKFPSLLKFDEQRNEAVIRASLTQLYGVEDAPCDSQMRELLDGVDAEPLIGAFEEVHRYLQREGLLQDYRFLEVIRFLWMERSPLNRPRSTVPMVVSARSRTAR